MDAIAAASSTSSAPPRRSARRSWPSEANRQVKSLPSVEMRSLSEKQIWHYDPIHRTWQVQPDLTVFPGSRAASATPPAPAS